MRHYERREFILQEGEAGDCFFVVAKGDVTIDATTAPGEKRLTTLTEGDTFGEIALVDTNVRTATARAGDSGADLVEINRARFVYLVGQQPAFALTVMRNLCRRISALDQRLREAQP